MRGAGDVYSINLVKKYIDTDVQHAKLSFKAIDNLKLPPQYHTSNIWSGKTTSSSNQSQSNGEGGAQDMVSFFSSTADELADYIERATRSISLRLSNTCEAWKE
jgi:nucleoporin p58/p45